MKIFLFLLKVLTNTSVINIMLITTDNYARKRVINMNVKFNKKDIVEMVEKYFDETLGIKGKVSITCGRQLVGYGMAEHEDCVVNFKLKGEMFLLDKKRDIELDVSEEVKASIKYFVEKEGHTYTGYRMLSGMEPKTTGYGMGEQTDYVPYFKGIEVGVKTDKINESNKRRGEVK